MSSTKGQERLRSPVREWAARIGLMFASLFFAILVAEGLSRIFVPISDLRENIALDGERIRDFLAPGSVYRQVSNEYDALTTITDRGHRVPAIDGNPDIVFIGDSFTFGYGLSDDQTFVSRYCGRQKLACANLGFPGSGTLRQVERLEKFLLDWNWRPREVRLFFFAHDFGRPLRRIPTASFLNNFFAPLNGLNLTIDFVFDRFFYVAEGVDIFELNFHSQLRFPYGTHRNIRITSKIPLLHVAIAHIDVAQQIAKGAHVLSRLLRSSHVGLAHNFNQRHACAIQINECSVAFVH